MSASVDLPQPVGADQRGDRAEREFEIDFGQGRRRRAVVNEVDRSQHDPDTCRRLLDRGGRIVEHGLVHDRLDSRPRRHRPREFRQRIADEAEREHEQREEEDDPRELTHRDVARTDPCGTEHDEADVRQRRDHVGERIEPTPPFDRTDARHADSVRKRCEPLGLALLGAVSLHQLHTLEALVHGGREVAELLLGSRVVRRHRTLVEDVRGDDEGEHDHSDDSERDVDDEQPDRRDEDHQHCARRERDRCDHADRGLGVDARSGDEVTVGMSSMPCDGLADQPVEDLVGVALRHPPHAGRGKTLVGTRRRPP